LLQTLAAEGENYSGGVSTAVFGLNDDAAAQPQWIAALLGAIEPRPDAGMCASQVRLFGEHRLDSAGMLVARDGSSKQRGNGRPPEDFPVAEETLFPSGSAALYRRAMLETVGAFDSRFFLYCEDTDLGLRARWAGWKCLYVPDAVVEHHYSHSAGGASPLKAYYVERNRLFVLAKNFPAGMLLAAPFATLARYAWHAWYLLQGRGAAARFRAEGHAGPKMIWYILRAHAALLAHVPRLWRQRREIRGRARITPAIFRHLLRSHSISARKVAAL
jgi:GT2 family glycosyltransferase